MKSDNVKKGMQQAPHRSLFNALGFTKEELEMQSQFLDRLFENTKRAIER